MEQELVDLVYSYRQVKRSKLLSLLAQYPEKRVLIFHNRAEADDWLETIKMLRFLREYCDKYKRILK